MGKQKTKKDEVIEKFFNYLDSIKISDGERKTWQRFIGYLTMEEIETSLNILSLTK